MVNCKHCGEDVTGRVIAHAMRCPALGRKILLKVAPENVVLDLFLEGNSINHIVYLLEYEFKIEYITEVIRAKLRPRPALSQALRDIRTEMIAAFGNQERTFALMDQLAQIAKELE